MTLRIEHLPDGRILIINDRNRSCLDLSAAEHESLKVLLPVTIGRVRIALPREKFDRSS